MRMLSRSIVLGVLAAAVVGTPAWAQGSRQYTLYFGAQGGLISVKDGTAGGKRDLIAAAGAHFLVTGARSGLLISVDQSFGTTKSGTVGTVVVDSAGNATSSSTTVKYTGVRRYTFAVLLFPVRHSIVQPYVGIGGGILHSTGNTPGGHVVANLGTQGFLTAIGGLEFRVAGLSAFGQAQVTSAPSVRTMATNLTDGSTEYDTGSLLQDPSFSVMAGIR
ncbi:MAG: hypothetical protein ACREL2_00705, partial [Gemmatimonadales bacterium]